MKESNYNFFINDNENDIHLIYNAFKNTLVSDDDCKVQKFIRQCDGDIKFNSEYLIQEEFNELISSGIIISDEINEKQSAIEINEKRIKQLSETNEMLHLVITPTLCCNFKCYYCFESTNSKKSNNSISMEVRNDIINFISMSITDNHIKKISITWYGGEPLIRQNIIFSMQEEIDKICKLHHVKIQSDIITNGILCSQETCDLLYKYGIKRVQVTIDGPEQIHNKRRYYPENPSNNYNLILENISKANENIRFDIRINIDRRNENFIFELIDDFIKRKIWPYKKNISLYTAQVESADKTDFELSRKEYTILQDRIRHYLMNKYNEITQTSNAKLHFFYPTFGGETGCGYGIFNNSWVISYNGDVYRCWEIIGRKEHAVGTMKDLLKDFGQSIVEKIKVDNKTFERWGCFDCKFFPVCGAGCPWEFTKNNEERRCTTWKNALEYRILNQYKLYLRAPNIFKTTPFNVGIR
jgi:uncharacterized protein